MDSNADTRALREYHERTKHSVARLQASRHFLDWENQPRPFKVYTTLPPIPLPRDFASSKVSALDALSLSTLDSQLSTPSIPTLTQLARLLHFSAGITRRRVYPGGQEYFFRAAACTGALYHIDLYLVCGALPDLEAGVYHFGPHDFALRRLRAGDHRAVVAAATGAAAAARRAPVIVVCASTYWRNTWKYQSRAYRHCFWDNGTLLANLFAIAAADRVSARLMLGFVDQTIETLLGLDADREAPISLVALGDQGNDTLPPAPPLTAVSFQTEPLSATEVDYPAIRAAQAASALQTPAEARAWREAPAVPAVSASVPGEVSLHGVPSPPAKTIEETILRRGSTRQFARAPISSAQLAAMLMRSTRGMPADYSFGGAAGALPTLLGDVYLIVNAVDGVAAGTYVYHPDRHALELLRAGDFRRHAGFLDLGQELAADAAVNFYLLADLEPLLQRWGNRAYRAAQLDAAIVGGRLYLAAYALGLGATGLTFFDDEVTDFFSPHAAGKSVMFLIAVGMPQRAERKEQR